MEQSTLNDKDKKRLTTLANKLGVDGWHLIRAFVVLKVSGIEKAEHYLRTEKNE